MEKKTKYDKPEDAAKVHESLRAGADIAAELLRLYGTEGIEACTTKLAGLDPDQRGWTLMAFVMFHANDAERREGEGFDRRWFDNGGPKLH